MQGQINIRSRIFQKYPIFVYIYIGPWQYGTACMVYYFCKFYYTSIFKGFITVVYVSFYFCTRLKNDFNDFSSAHAVSFVNFISFAGSLICQSKMLKGWCAAKIFIKRGITFRAKALRQRTISLPQRAFEALELFYLFRHYTNLLIFPTYLYL